MKKKNNANNAAGRGKKTCRRLRKGPHFAEGRTKTLQKILSGGEKTVTGTQEKGNRGERDTQRKKGTEVQKSGMWVRGGIHRDLLGEKGGLDREKSGYQKEKTILIGLGEGIITGLKEAQRSSYPGYRQ